MSSMRVRSVCRPVSRAPARVARVAHTESARPQSSRTPALAFRATLRRSSVESIEPPSTGDGRPLEARTRDYFEPRLGRDLSGVRVHTDAEAARSAAGAGAEAYTVGRDVYFRAGRYDPDSAHGRRLLAHELVHTAQQGQGGATPRVQRTITVRQPGRTTPPHTKTNGEVVVGLFDELCKDTAWELVSPSAGKGGGKTSTAPAGKDAGAGQDAGAQKPDPDASVVLRPKNAEYCKDTTASKTRTSCDCVCNFVSAGGPHANIEIDPALDQTTSSTTQADTFEIKLRGLDDPDIKGVQGAQAPKGNPLQKLSDPAWLILGHELCGHAMTSLPRGAKPGATRFAHESTAKWDESAVDIENRIRREHSAVRGTDLGIRAGDFTSLEGIHHGATVALPKTMTLMTLLQELGVPATSHAARCDSADFYEHCGSKAALPGAPILDRVVLTMANTDVFLKCSTQSFAAGTLFSIEGVFWHLASGTETKADIAAKWGVTVAKLDKANKLFANGVDALAATASVPAGTSVIVPYNLASGTTRFFFKSAPHDCGR